MIRQVAFPQLFISRHQQIHSSGKIFKYLLDGLA